MTKLNKQKATAQQLAEELERHEILELMLIMNRRAEETGHALVSEETKLREQERERKEEQERKKRMHALQLEEKLRDSSEEEDNSNEEKIESDNETAPPRTISDLRREQHISP